MGVYGTVGTRATCICRNLDTDQSLVHVHVGTGHIITIVEFTACIYIVYELLVVHTAESHKWKCE